MRHTMNGCHTICKIPDIFERVRCQLYVSRNVLNLTESIFSTTCKCIRELTTRKGRFCRLMFVSALCNIILLCSTHPQSLYRPLRCTYTVHSLTTSPVWQARKWVASQEWFFRGFHKYIRRSTRMPALKQPAADSCCILQSPNNWKRERVFFVLQRTGLIDIF
jgi:hypothetical protein